MDMNSILGRIAGGFAIKAAAIIAAIWLASTVYSYVAGVFATVQGAM